MRSVLGSVPRIPESETPSENMSSVVITNSSGNRKDNVERGHNLSIVLYTTQFSYEWPSSKLVCQCDQECDRGKAPIAADRPYEVLD